jgi:hypothetical protein
MLYAKSETVCKRYSISRIFGAKPKTYHTRDKIRRRNDDQQRKNTSYNLNKDPTKEQKNHHQSLKNKINRLMSKENRDVGGGPHQALNCKSKKLDCK